MNIQERVLTALKPVVASKGFGEKTVEGLATNLVANGLTDESTDEEITAAITGASNYFNLIQSENTRYVNEYKKKNPAPAPSPAPAANPPETPAPNSLEAQLAELTGKFNQLLEQNNSLSTKQKWEKLAEANGITNATLIAKWKPSKEEDFDSAMEELKAFSKDFVKQSANDRSPGKPNAGEGGGNTSVSKITQAGQTVLAKIKAQNEARLKN